MTLEAYLQTLRGRKILVVGLGVSNRPLARLLLDAGLDVTGCDKTPREKLDAELLALEARGMALRVGPDYLEGLEGDVIFRTPGLHPEQLRALTDRGAVLTSEMEAFFQVCPCPILAVTGSDGKTTTTSLIAQLLRQAGRTVWLGGNIGAPLLDQAPRMQPTDLAVLELSSFQLMTLRQSPGVAVVTNLAPNHLDIHRDMDEYIAAKKNLFLYQRPQDTLVLNLDNDVTRGFAQEARGGVLWFSRQTEPETGAFFQNGSLWRRTRGQTVRLLDRSELLLRGDHNVENFLAAVCAVDGLVSDEDIRAVGRSFAGVEHRIERVRELDGAVWYNDSIASSPSRTMAGLRSFTEPVVLIAGGYDKHIPYDVLGPVIRERCRALLLTGDTSEKIRAALEQTPGYAGDPPVLEFAALDQAVLAAREWAKPGDAVILSPASASFDRYKNFEQRGRVFKDLVNALPEQGESR